MASLRIAINDRPLRLAKTGVGHYIHELMAWLPRIAPQHAYLGFLSHTLKYRPRMPDTADPHYAPGSPARRPPWAVRRVMECFYNAAFRVTSRLRRCDVYHEPNHIAMPSSLVTLTTVHDMSVIRHPEWHPADRVAWYEREFSGSVRRTAHFITPSEYTKRELVELTGVKPERVTVIPLAPRQEFQPATSEAVGAWRARVGLPNPYFLFVGTFEPRKNITSVLAAYAALPVTVRNRYPLVLAGPSGWGMTSLDERAASLGIQHCVIPLGYVSDEELSVLYTAAKALVWPSWYEGFGLPPLECMACGTPVITSNAASLPEVVGGDAVVVDPADVPALTEAMHHIAEDPKIAENLSARGRQRASQFTWQRCAAAHVMLYEQCAAQAG